MNALSRSSYSHRGRYYPLAEIPRFDPPCLWSFQAVWFSRWGTLVAPVDSLVRDAPRGYVAEELRQLLHVEVKVALRQLVEQHGLARKPAKGIPGNGSAEVLPVELKAALVLFASLLGEPQPRFQQEASGRDTAGDSLGHRTKSQAGKRSAGDEAIRWRRRRGGRCWRHCRTHLPGSERRSGSEGTARCARKGQVRLSRRP